MTFLTLQNQLRDHIRARIRRRELTGSGLARAAGFPQGHLSNFLNARRGLSLESMDRLLETLGIEVLDLVSADDVQRRSPRRAPEQGEEAVALVAIENAARARFAPEHVLGTRVFSKAFLRRLRPRNDNDRVDWLRFVVVKLDIESAREIFPLPITGATLLLARCFRIVLRSRICTQSAWAAAARRDMCRSWKTIWCCERAICGRSWRACACGRAEATRNTSSGECATWRWKCEPRPSAMIFLLLEEAFVWRNMARLRRAHVAIRTSRST
jgi:transcriptional regulator with XRE-family HTH domain